MSIIASTSSNNKRGDPSQIPKGEDVPSNVQKAVSEERGVESQRKSSSGIPITAKLALQLFYLD